MNPTAEELGEPALRVAGLQLWVHGHQFQNSAEYFDANWLRVTAHAGAAGASVWASGAILMAPDLVDWSGQCEALAQGERPKPSSSHLNPS
jgi:hypothetical protein